MNRRKRSDSLTGLVFNIQKFSLHDGPGIRTAAFFQGCNMRCKWCANPESFELAPKHPTSEAKAYTVDELARELLKDKAFYDASGGGVTLTGGEPLLQPLFVCELCDYLRALGVSVWLETAANVPTEVFLEVLRRCEGVHIDLKHHDNAAHLEGTGVPMTLVFANIRAALETGVRVIVRIPVVPGFNNCSEDSARFAQLLASLGAREVQLMPFHQLGAHKHKQLGLDYAYAKAPGLRDEELEPFADTLRTAGFAVQVGG